MQGLPQHWGLVYNDGAGLLLHKRKDGGVQWLYCYTIHERRREIGLGALRDVSLKQARKCANLMAFCFT
ncbi:hypothetical protein GGR08_000360 [Bartonella fuyuanensis]|uniref:Integrase DNA-binding domain-containing protein n=1 Tax=Bartonella fuyuanensis TaxID=1460968 RepID=A0A840DX34_9HYPH|nr:hypothetical protein [Bartonella fuyuanensis]